MCIFNNPFAAKSMEIEAIHRILVGAIQLLKDLKALALRIIFFGLT